LDHPAPVQREIPPVGAHHRGAEGFAAGSGGSTLSSAKALIEQAELFSALDVVPSVTGPTKNPRSSEHSQGAFPARSHPLFLEICRPGGTSCALKSAADLYAVRLGSTIRTARNPG